jgi:hypothetical protein
MGRITLGKETNQRISYKLQATSYTQLPKQYGPFENGTRWAKLREEVLILG